ncbi:MAG: hypothetical protein IJ335_09230, partial [Lachnospiraceae bacterium]|nr:hypothetical protein [Lachnospiraceae bacterium]
MKKIFNHTKRPQQEFEPNNYEWEYDAVDEAGYDEELTEEAAETGVDGAEGYYDENGRWVETGGYYDEDGKALTGWVAAGSDWYYVKNGHMLRNTWIAKDATGAVWYYVGNNGAM